jgi:hypothetical protein
MLVDYRVEGTLSAINNNSDEKQALFLGILPVGNRVNEDIKNLWSRHRRRLLGRGQLLRY